MTVYDAVNAVMRDVQNIAKDSQAVAGNTRYKFRGVDATMDAVGPALREHGVIVGPIGVAILADREVTSSKGSRMRAMTLLCTYRFSGPEGDWLDFQAIGEALDVSDKAATKAQSVAYRIVLLQALCVPTGDLEPDAEHHELNEVSEEVNRLHKDIIEIAAKNGMTDDGTMVHFRKWSGGVDIRAASKRQLTEYLTLLVDWQNQKISEKALARDGLDP